MTYERPILGGLCLDICNFSRSRSIPSVFTFILPKTFAFESMHVHPRCRVLFLRSEESLRTKVRLSCLEAFKRGLKSPSSLLQTHLRVLGCHIGRLGELCNGLQLLRGQAIGDIGDARSSDGSGIGIGI